MSNRVMEGLKSLKKLGYDEETVETRGIRVTLRTLGRSDLSAIQEHVEPLRELLTTKGSLGTLTEYTQMYKVEMLAYSIQEVNGMSFRDEVIDTGEVAEINGVERPVHKQKHVALREVLMTWQDAIIDVLTKKLEELTAKSEAKAAEGVVFENEDLRAQISELELEIEALKAQLKEAEITSSAGQGISEKALKDEIFKVESPESSSESAPEAADSTPEDNEPSHMEEEEDFGTVEISAPEPQPQGPLYVDEHGEPLTGHQLEVMQAQDEEILRRAKAKAAAEMAAKRRVPMNQHDVRVHEQPVSSQEQAMRTANHKSDVPDNVAWDREEVAILSQPSQKTGGPVDVNQGPRPNVNPRFNPPKK